MKDGQPQQSIPESKHLAGDGVRLKMPLNRESLWIEGDGCSVEIQVNHGLVRVTGDGCRVRIERNLGRVDYVGDGGRVYLGLGCDADTVTYRGDGGIVEAGNKGRVAAGARRSRVVRNGRLVVTEVKANETTGDECLRIQTGVKPGARISINLNGVNGKCVNIHGTTC
ncbi:uncharacterized protein LOC106635867 [Copidosoma floridanum]|uniref:uncharacterized protein LOC106635867 n=1 Tax=Copidosoma floridanum TaxID=29053 RepID=UPI0006C9424E|nr:uncharacterized protein LOC106635867 [Copidosoma floridanum]